MPMGMQTLCCSLRHGQCANNVISATTASNDDGWTRKSLPERESPPKRKMPPEDLGMIEQSQKEHNTFMPYEDRHSQQKPRWYLEASREP